MNFLKTNLFLSLLLVFVLSACNSGEEGGSSDMTTDDAVEFNDAVVDLYDGIIDAWLDLETSLYGDSDEFGEAHDAYYEVIDDALAYLDDDKNFDSDFKDSAYDLFNAFRDAGDYYPDFFAYWDNLWDATEEDDAQYDENYDEMEEMLEDAEDAFTEAQEGFADEWDFILI